MQSPKSFNYHEPSIPSLLTITSYLYLLNVARWLFQRLVGAGLIGEILIGIIYGTPLAGWLDESWEEFMVLGGYVGLLLIVYEGGITTSLPVLLPLLPLSLAIALTGLLTPICLSFMLTPAYSYSLLESFAAGSSMASTSLGTTLAVLAGTSLVIQGEQVDLRQTKLGVVLVGAAVMDDVVAFVLSEIIEILGTEGGGDGLGGHIGTAVGVTVGLGVVTGLACRFVLKPFVGEQVVRCARKGGDWAMFGLLVVVGIGMIAAAGYAGTSPLYGVYLGGLALSYLHDHTQSIVKSATPRHTPHSSSPFTGPSTSMNERNSSSRDNQEFHFASLPSPMNPMIAAQSLSDPLDFSETYRKTLSPLVDYLLLPIFFGSIGYSIPFLSLWQGQIVWRGILYALLMFIGKLVCGLWVFIPGIWGSGWRDTLGGGLFLGFAMVARGEIGLLIAQIGYQTERRLLGEEAFLVVIWAIVINTVVGPIGVGIILKRFGGRVVSGGWR